jgi:hypothetical protein
LKQIVGIDIGNYVFSPSNGIVALNGLPIILTQNQVLQIINTTVGVLIYSCVNSNLNGNVSNNYITLNYNTSIMNNSDSLFILIDLPDALCNNSFGNILSELQIMHKDLFRILEKIEAKLEKILEA